MTETEKYIHPINVCELCVFIILTQTNKSAMYFRKKVFLVAHPCVSLSLSFRQFSDRYKTGGLIPEQRRWCNSNPAFKVLFFTNLIVFVFFCEVAAALFPPAVLWLKETFGILETGFWYCSGSGAVLCHALKATAVRDILIFK